VNVYLREGGDQLPTDVILKWVGRSDLTPTLRSLEFTVKLIDGVQDKLKVGASVWAGRENLRYEIVKTDRAQPIGQVQGKNQQQAMKVTALLHRCASVARPLNNAVILTKTTLGAIYRACGAFMPVASDFAVPRFTCFKGHQPSYPLAQALQEEGAALVLRNGSITAMRLTDMVKQNAMADIGQVDSSAKIESEFLQLQDIPSFYSVDDSAAIVLGQMGQARRVSFMARADERQLRNASCVLVRSKTVDSTICQQYQAGDVLRVAGENLVIITAAHAFENLEGAQESRSRLWLGKLINAQ
jgi:hypothetical protein